MGKDIKDTYQQNHLDRALYVDSSGVKEDAANGGGHLLPTIEEFSKVLSDLRIAPDSHVVAYDDKNGAIASARFGGCLNPLAIRKYKY